MTAARHPTKRWLRLGACGLFVSALVATGCDGPAPKATNVLVLSLDTTRADRFGATGYDAADTPQFDAWAAAHAVQFEETITTVPLTLPSHTSIMTGTYPVFHGVHDNDGYVVDDDVTTLAEILGKEGWTTAAFVAAVPLRHGVNLAQGFDVYDDDFQADWTEAEKAARTAFSFGFVERRADQVNTAVERWLDDHGDERFFLWAHYFDPHQAYEPPQPYDSQFADSPYDGEIAFMDEQFGRLLAMLEARDLTERTMVVVVGDHGESLGQHGESTHASFLYDPTMKVPLWIAAPGHGFSPGTRVASQVRTIDIAPTVLDLLSLPSGPEMQGSTLRPLLDDPAAPWTEEAYLESHFSQFQFGWAPLRALRTGDWKYVQAPQPELYDLVNDPNELHNVIDAHPERATEMAERLARLARRMSHADRGRSVSTSNDPEARAQLAALGYVGGGATDSLRSAPFPTPEEHAQMVNPVDRAIVIFYVNGVQNMLLAREFQEAIRLGRSGLQLDPGNISIQMGMARAHGSLRQFDAAKAAIARILEAQPDHAEAYVVRGNVEMLEGDLEAAVQSFTVAVERQPDQVDHLRVLGRLFARLGRYPEAAEHLQAVIDRGEGDWSAYLDLAEILAQLDRDDEAQVTFQEALDRNPYSPLVLFSIAAFYDHLGQAEFAMTMYESVLRVDPEHLGAHVRLGALLLATGDTDDTRRALELLERVVARAPGSPLAEQAQALLASYSSSSP